MVRKGHNQCRTTKISYKTLSGTINKMATAITISCGEAHHSSGTGAWRTVLEVVTAVKLVEPVKLGPGNQPPHAARELLLLLF